MLTPKPFITIGPHQNESRLRIFLSQVEYTRMSTDPSQRDVTKRKKDLQWLRPFFFSLYVQLILSLIQILEEL